MEAVSTSAILLRLQQTLYSTLWRTGYAKQSARLEQFLNDGSLDPTDIAFVKAVVAPLYDTQGQVRVHELAEQCSLSVRQLERRFKRLTGFSPKLMARIIRFEAVRTQLLSSSSLRMVDTANHFGYTDQTHFIRDFKMILGWTPTEFISAALERGRSHFYYTPDPRPPYHS